MFCEPKVDDWGGIPAGLQSDKKGHLWVADMRLGILHVTPDGSFEQVDPVCSTITFERNPRIVLRTQYFDLKHPAKATVYWSHPAFGSAVD